MFPSLRSCTGSVSVHEATQTSCHGTQEGEHSNTDLSRRHAGYGRNPVPFETASESGYLLVKTSRIHSESEEVCNDTNTVHRVSRFPGGLDSYDLVTSIGKSTQSSKGMPSHAQHVLRDRPSTCPPNWPHDPHLTCDSGSTTPLQGSSETENSSSQLGAARLQQHCRAIRRDSSGLELVDKLLGNHDCSSHNASLSLSHTRDRCLNTRMGCLSPRIKCSNGRAMVTSRIQESHQLVGVEGCLPSSSIFRQQFPSLPRQSLYGQCFSHCLHQSEGGHSFSKAVPSCPGVLGLVCSETNHHTCRTHPRTFQCDCRLRVQTFEGLQQLDAEQANLQQHSAEIRPVLRGPVCVFQEHATEGVLQLEAGSNDNSSRHSNAVVEAPSSLPLPTICSGGESSSENQGGEGALRTASGSRLASTAVALPTAQHVDKPSPDPTEQAGPSQQPPEQDTPNGGVQPHDTSRLACIRNGLESLGFSEDSSLLICSSWRKSTSKSYETAWKRWSSWYHQREVNPVSTSLINIVQFLTEIFQEGKEYSTVNSYRSAIP